MRWLTVSTALSNGAMSIVTDNSLLLGPIASNTRAPADPANAVLVYHHRWVQPWYAGGTIGPIQRSGRIGQSLLALGTGDRYYAVVRTAGCVPKQRVRRPG